MNYCLQNSISKILLFQCNILQRKKLSKIFNAPFHLLLPPKAIFFSRTGWAQRWEKEQKEPNLTLSSEQAQALRMCFKEEPVCRCLVVGILDKTAWWKHNRVCIVILHAVYCRPTLNYPERSAQPSRQPQHPAKLMARPIFGVLRREWLFLIVFELIFEHPKTAGCIWNIVPLWSCRLRYHL